MIRQYKITLTTEADVKFSNDLGYQFYGLLMELVDSDFADLMHANGIHPISQYILTSKGSDTLIWTVNLLSDQACRQISPIIESKDSYYLTKYHCKFTVKQIKEDIIPTDEVFLTRAHKLTGFSKVSIEFLTPASFKTDRLYQIFPSAELLINNLLHRWNSYSEKFLIDDKDAVEALMHGIRISGYDLRSCHYRVKDVSIPSFKGEVSFQKKLSLSIAELFHALLQFSEYSGIGIKTSLGMGAARIQYKGNSATDSLDIPI